MCSPTFPRDTPYQGRVVSEENMFDHCGQQREHHQSMEHGCTLSSHFQYHDSGALLPPGSASELCLVRFRESGSAERL